MACWSGYMPLENRIDVIEWFVDGAELGVRLNDHWLLADAHVVQRPRGELVPLAHDFPEPDGFLDFVDLAEALVCDGPAS